MVKSKEKHNESAQQGMDVLGRAKPDKSYDSKANRNKKKCCMK